MAPLHPSPVYILTPILPSGEARKSCHSVTIAVVSLLGSKSKHREMETYETNPDFARVSFLRNTKSAALGVSGFEKRNTRVPRAVSPANRLNISLSGSETELGVHVAGIRSFVVMFAAVVTAVGVAAGCVRGANFFRAIIGPLVTE